MDDLKNRLWSSLTTISQLDVLKKASMWACNSGNILSCLGCNLGSLIVGNIVPFGRHDTQYNGIQQNDTHNNIMLHVAIFLIIVTVIMLIVIAAFSGLNDSTCLYCVAKLFILISSWTTLRTVYSFNLNCTIWCFTKSIAWEDARVDIASFLAQVWT